MGVADPLNVTCYLDESATDGSTPAAVVGGVLLNNSQHRKFVADWRAMLNLFELWPGLHMKEFGPDKRLGARTSLEKFAICQRAVEIIEANKIFSMACSLDNDVYGRTVSKLTKRWHSQYQLCFINVVLVNRKKAKVSNYGGPISYVMDCGNPNAEHVRRAFHEMKELSTEVPTFFNLGTLRFENDEREFGLQAADIVCWAVRRYLTGSSFLSQYAPIAKMLRGESHICGMLLEDGLVALEDHFATRNINGRL